MAAIDNIRSNGAAALAGLDEVQTGISAILAGQTGGLNAAETAETDALVLSIKNKVDETKALLPTPTV